MATLRYKKFNSKAAGVIKYLADEHPSDAKLQELKLKFAQATKMNDKLLFDTFHQNIDPSVKEKVIEMDDSFVDDLAKSQVDYFNIANLWNRPGQSTKDIDLYHANLYSKLQDLLRV